MKNYPNIKLRQKLFFAVQDIPYRIGSQENDASCVAKTKLLGELLTRTGLKCRVIKCDVRWKDVGLPKYLLKMTQRPVVNHFFLQVYIPETKKWVSVDPTWDPSFKKVFNINNWDGQSDTVIAYPTSNFQIIGNPFSFEFRDFNPKDKFTILLNQWYLSLK